MLYMNIKKLRKVYIALLLAIATHHAVSVSAHQMLSHRVTYLSDTMERYDTLVIAIVYMDCIHNIILPLCTLPMMMCRFLIHGQ